MTRLLDLGILRHALRVFIFRFTRGILTSAPKGYRLFEASLRLHQYQQASLIAETARRRWPDAIDVVSMQCMLAFKAGSLPEAFALLDPRQYGSARVEVLTLLNDWVAANATGLVPRRHIKGRTPQENHLLFLEALRDSCKELHQAGGSVNPQACRHWARLLNHSSERSLTDTIATLVQRQLTDPGP